MTSTTLISAETEAREPDGAAMVPTGTLPNHVIGLYIDMSQATSLAGTRLCMVGKLPDGSLWVEALESTGQTPYPGPPAGMPVTNLTPADFSAIVDASWNCR